MIAAARRARPAFIRRFGGYRWVGVYDVTANEIAAVGWNGPAAPTYPRFPRSQGLCRPALPDDAHDHACVLRPAMSWRIPSPLDAAPDLTRAARRSRDPALA